MKRRRAACTAVLWSWVAAACAADGTAPAPAPADVVATVGVTPIFRSELDTVLQRARGSGAQRALAETDGPGGRQWLEAMALDQLVDLRLLRDEIDREKVTVVPLEVEGRLEQVKKQATARGVDWQRFLEQSGFEEQALREQIAIEIAIDKLIRPKLTPAAIAKGFEQHQRELDGTRLRISHIVLRPDAVFGEEGVAKTLERAATIRLEIVQGATTFAEAARLHSVGPSRERAGDLGWIGAEGPLIDAFTKQAFALAKGDVSKPFTTPFGVHIVQVTATEPGRLQADAVRHKLESLLAANLLRETLARLRATTLISFAAGVAHFDPATPAGAGPRRILVGVGPDAGGRPARP